MNELVDEFGIGISRFCDFLVLVVLEKAKTPLVLEEISERFEAFGAKRPPRSSLYVCLRRLSRKGLLLTSVRDRVAGNGAGHPSNLYSLESSGQELAVNLLAIIDRMRNPG